MFRISLARKRPIFLLCVSAPLRRNRERGASLVEYAFILFFFLTLMFGINAFGHALFVYHHLDHATKEATRYASVRGYNCNQGETVASCQASNSASGIA